MLGHYSKSFQSFLLISALILPLTSAVEAQNYDEIVLLSPADSDSDGVVDALDNCPDDPQKVAPGQCGCGKADIDSDGDQIADCLDLCPNDPAKIAAGVCGCGVMDADTDGDGVLDCLACTAVDVSDTKTRLGRILRKQRQAFKKLLKMYRQLTSSKYGKTIELQAKDIYRTNLAIIAGVPAQILSCPENNLCVHTSTDDQVLNYKANARGLDLLSRKLVNRIGILTGGTKRKARVLLKQSKGLYKRSIKAVETLPAKESVC